MACAAIGLAVEQVVRSAVSLAPQVLPGLCGGRFSRPRKSFPFKSNQTWERFFFSFSKLSLETWSLFRPRSAKCGHLTCGNSAGLHASD